MPFEREFAEALVDSMKQDGWKTNLPNTELPNPLKLTFARESETQSLVIHARKITKQGVEHNRPADEMHSQMIFDGDRRGEGIRNNLRFTNDAKTVLFGFYRLEPLGYVVAAYDPQVHMQYAYSKSLQIKFGTLEQAAKLGIAFQTRQSGETIVAFHITELPQYLEFSSEFHELASERIEEEIVEEQDTPQIVGRAIKPVYDVGYLPDLPILERKRDITEIGKYIRNHLFAKSIRSVYERCAICGFQYDYILDAAHIVPVADGGTDTYDNGLGLCPNCHRMFDKGFLLVDETGHIFINPRHAEEYQQIGRAGSLENLRSTIREFLWLPEDKDLHPSASNLKRTFLMRR